MNYTLYEQAEMSYQALNLSPADALMDSIEALNKQHGATLIEVGRHGLRTTQFVGVLHTPQGTLNILPKIDDGRDGEQGALQNLVTMLCYAYDVRLIHPQESTLLTGRGGWLEILTGLFCRLLLRELQHGMERLYIETEAQSTALKGRWLIERQLARTPHLHHAFEVRYDDFSPDTRLNQVFLSVTNRLLGVSRLLENRRLLTEIQNCLSAVSVPLHIIPAELNTIPFTRLNERFKPAFQLARLFIESMTQILQRGAAPLWAFVFDMNKLFESFTANFLARHWREIAGHAYRNITLQAQMAGESLVFLAQTAAGDSLFKLVPDLILRDKLHQPRLIIDTKYKRLNARKPSADISQADVYQMLAYATRLNCPHILLLYPSTSAGKVTERLITHQTDIQIEVRTLNLHQPMANTAALIHEFRGIFAPYL